MKWELVRYVKSFLSVFLVELRVDGGYVSMGRAMTTEKCAGPRYILEVGWTGHGD